MTIELFTLSGSPYGWRVQLALEHKQVPYQLRWLSLSAGDLATPDYRAKNPRGRVPALVDGDYVLYESLAILAYLEAKWPAPALFGETPEAIGRVWRALSEYTSYLDAAVEDFIVPIYFGRATEDAARIRAAIPVIEGELARYEALLAHAPYIAGDELTAADFVVLPAIQSILRAAGKPAAGAFTLPFLPLAPALSRWRARLESVPYYPQTIPPHWR